MESCIQTKQQRILKRILWSVGGVVLGAVLLLALAFADSLGFFHRPPLRLEQNGSTVIAHIETLGEYQTTTALSVR
jgi:hypothetical protein